MPERPIEELLSAADRPVAPSPTFARSLLERLERVLADEGLADAEMDRHHGVELPAREAASLIGTDHHLGPPLGGGT